MSAPTPVVTAWFDLSGGSSAFFTWDDPVRGVWDNVTYLWAGDIATDITGYGRTVTITRGRSSQLDDMQAGTATVVANNYTRDIDPFHVSSPFYGNIKPGKRMSIAGAGVTVFDGNIDDYDYSYGVGQVSLADIVASDQLAVLAQKDLDSFTGTVGQLTGARIGVVLARAEVNMAVGAQLDTGQSTCQADVVAAQTNAVAYCHLVARTDLGRFFAARDRPLTFKDRHSVLNTAAEALIFADVGSYPSEPLTSETGVWLTDESGGWLTTEASVTSDVVPFHGVGVGFGSDVLFTRTVVSRVGGSIETFTDADAIVDYGIQSTQDAYTGLLLETDGQSYDMGLYLLGVFAQPAQQFLQFVVNLAGLTDLQQAQVLSLDVGSRVRGVYTPDGVGAPIDRMCVVEGLRHDVGPAQWVVSLLVSDGDQLASWVWDDVTYGVWDGPGSWVF